MADITDKHRYILQDKVNAPTGFNVDNLGSVGNSLPDNTREEKLLAIIEHKTLEEHAAVELIEALIQAEITQALREQLEEIELRTVRLCDNASSDMAPTFVKAVPLSVIKQMKEKL